MNLNIEIALIGFAGAVLGVFISSVVTIITMKSNQKADTKNTDRILASQYITDKRVKWIQDLREEVAAFNANVRFIIDSGKARNCSVYRAMLPDALKKTNKSANKVKLMLNPGGDKDLIDIIDRILKCLAITDGQDADAIDQINLDLDRVMLLVQVTLKSEWERSKKEIREGKA